MFYFLRNFWLPGQTGPEANFKFIQNFLALINSYMTHTLPSCVVSRLLFLLPQGSSSSGRTRSFSLLPHLTPSSSPNSQRHQGQSAAPSNIVTITHHKSPAAARRSRSQYPGQLLEVKEVGDDGKAHSKVLF